MKVLLLCCVLVFGLMLIACSFVTDYVVLNESNDRIQIRYVLKKTAPYFSPNDLPRELGIKLISELEKQTAWRSLESSRITANAETRTVVITLMPQEALRIESMSNTKCAAENPNRAADFTIEEIQISGANGAIRLQGEQARKSFIKGRKGECELTYW